MWNRKDLKAKGKASFKANFWKCVATALILGIIGGGMSSVSSSSSSAMNIFNNRDNKTSVSVTADPDGSINISGNNDDGTKDEIATVQVDTDVLDKEDAASVDEEQVEVTGVAIAIIFMVIFLITLVAMAIGFVIDAFLINPIELGCRRFFRKNLDEPAKLSNLMYAFDNSYMNIVKTMFVRDICTFLWSMLFIIPGIVKSYEYKMIPYILSEDPTMSRKEAFAESKRLMTGNKWKAFVLDLSFILWDLGSLMTCGLLGTFYVNPYKQATDAALYEALKYGTSAN